MIESQRVEGARALKLTQHESDDDLVCCEHVRTEDRIEAVYLAAIAYVKVWQERETDPAKRYAHGPIREAHKKLVAAVKTLKMKRTTSGDSGGER